jgi:transcriptional regulator with XRE-family HTH domain
MKGRRTPATMPASTLSGCAAPRRRTRRPVTSKALRQDRADRLVQGAGESAGTDALRLKAAIGHAVRHHRQACGLSLAALAKRMWRSTAMLSQIENGISAPSLDTLRLLAETLRLPVTALLRRYEERGEATFVRAGRSLKVAGGTPSRGQPCRLLAYAVDRPVTIKIAMITLAKPSDAVPPARQPGVAFLYMLSGEVGYRRGASVYHLRPGDALTLDPDVPHGPETLLRLPIRLFSAFYGNPE